MRDQDLVLLFPSWCFFQEAVLSNEQSLFPFEFSSVQLSWVAQSCLTLRNTMECSRPGLPVHHQLLEFIQTHVHWVSDDIQPPHPLSFPPFSSCLQSFLASGSFPMSQFFTSSGQGNGASSSASVPPMNIQDWFPLGVLWLDWLVWSPCSPRDSQESSPTPQFKSINSSGLSLLHSPTLISIRDHWKNQSLD